MVLTVDEVSRVMTHLDGDKWLAAMLLYGGWLRLLEALRLRVKDLATPYKQVMHQTMNRIIFFVAGLVCLPSTAFATTGWDRHDIRIAGYRIHGANGSSFVHRANSDITRELALCSTLDAKGMLIGPPDYLVTDTHIAIRYPIVTPANGPPNHFLIRIEDGQVTGPLKDTEFIKLPAVSEAMLKWRTPLTATDRLHRFVAIVIACVSLVFLGIAFAAIRWFRSCRRRHDSHQLDGLTPPTA